LHLYESAGFHNIRDSISYVKDVWSMLYRFRLHRPSLLTVDCESKKWKLRELFVGLGIRLYARLRKGGFDIIPAWLRELILQLAIALPP
jgi:hypothetical protein